MDSRLGQIFSADCYIIYVTNKNPASCYGRRIYPDISLSQPWQWDISLSVPWQRDISEL